jgi:hypothetical protein
MATANTNAAAGDTVYLRGGIYATGIAPVNSGTSSSRITFKGYTGEIAKIFGTAASLSARNRSYITFDGISADSNKVFADLRTANHIWVLNCTLVNSSDQGGWPVGILMYTNSRYNRVANSTVGNSGYMSSNDDIGGLINLGDWSDTADATAYNLLEGNNFYHGGHHVLEIASKYNVIRNNTFHNDNWTSCPRPSAGNLCGNRNIGIYDDHLDAYWNVIEGNRIAFSGASIDDATGASGLTVRCTHTIVRNNLVYLNDGPGISLYTDGTGTYDAWYAHIYHNVFYKNGVSPLSQSDFRYTFGIVFDNVFGNNPPMPITDVAIKNNLFNQNTGGDVYFYYTNAALQTVLGNYYATASNNSSPMAAITGNTISDANPMFADVGAAANVTAIGSFDFHLQSTSPAIDKGVFLTATTGAGAGKVIPVADAGYFIDGYGIVDGDMIQLQGQTQTARIVGVDYAVNSITVDQSLTWTSNLGVTLAYTGSAPDIGAYEYSASADVQQEKSMISRISNHPNRVGGGVTIDFAGLPRGAHDCVSLRLYGVDGREIRRYENIRAGALYIPKTNLVEGVYSYETTVNGNHVASGKIVMQ